MHSTILFIDDTLNATIAFDFLLWDHISYALLVLFFISLRERAASIPCARIDVDLSNIYIKICETRATVLKAQ